MTVQSPTPVALRVPTGGGAACLSTYRVRLPVPYVSGDCGARMQVYFVAEVYFSSSSGFDVAVGSGSINQAVLNSLRGLICGSLC